MSLSLALATAALLAAEPANLPAGHPPIQPGTQASPAVSPSAPAPSGALPQGHPPVGSPTGRAAPSADELLQQLDSTEGLKGREKTFEVASALGKLYYTNGRTTDALTYLQQAEEKAKPTRELFLAQRKKLGGKVIPSAEQAGCGFGPTMAMEAMGKEADARAKKGDAAGAAACARAALVPVHDVEVMHAHALYLKGNADAALSQYARVLEVSPAHEEALFSRSAVLYETRGEDVKSLKTAREGFEAVVAAYPESGRVPMAKRLSQMADEMVKAGGRKAWLSQRAEDRKIRLSQILAPGAGPMAGAMAGAGPMAGGAQQQGAAGPAPLTPEMVEAVQNTERTPELEAGLAKLVEEGEEHLARGRFKEALAAYTRVVPFQPENGRAKAGMAWSLVGLGRPMADRIWGVAVGADPAAVESLGDTLQAKGDAKGAKALWAKLKDSAPTYPNKAALEAKLSK
jgi:tetratricopeptide (TPR) repeat protein